jgi:O-antigen ligase
VREWGRSRRRRDTGRVLRPIPSRRALPDHYGNLRAARIGSISSFPLLYGVLALPLLIAAFAGLPRLVRVGPISGQGALTIVQILLIGGATLACGRYPARLLKRLIPYFCFLVWVGTSLFWAPPDTAGAQNGLVYLLFGLLMLFSGTLAARDPAGVQTVINRAVTWITWIALALVVVELKVHGLTKDTEEGWWIGPRPLAILGIVVLTRHLVKWYYGDSRARVSIVLWMAAIVVSVSRAAAAIGLVLIGLVVLAQMRFRLRRAVMSLPVFVGAVLVVIGMALFWAPLRDHMFAGDTKLRVAGTKINVSGRWTMWTAIVESALERPLIGKGLGSAVQVITTTFASTPGQMTQPHNDYLRLWHDLGAIGLTLYLIAVGLTGWILFRDWYANERRRAGPAQLEITGLLTLLAILAASLTDNPLVYPSVMATAGIFIGAGLGARVYQVDAPPAPGIRPGGGFGPRLPSGAAGPDARSPAHAHSPEDA